MRIQVEQIPAWFIRRVKRVHEPELPPRRPRLGLSEREVADLQRPPRRLIVGSRRTGDFWDRRIDERLAEKPWIEMPRKH